MSAPVNIAVEKLDTPTHISSVFEGEWRSRGNGCSEQRLARRGAERLWSLLTFEEHWNALGALSGTLLVRMDHAGLKAINPSDMQLTTDANAPAVPNRTADTHQFSVA